MPKRILKLLPTLGSDIDARARSGSASPGTYPRPGLPGGPRLPLGLPPGTGHPMPSTLASGSTPGGRGLAGGAEYGNPYGPAYPEQFPPADAQYLVLAAHEALSGERVLTAGDGLLLEVGAPGEAAMLSALPQP